MNNETIEKSCKRLRDLLIKLPENEQQEVMLTTERMIDEQEIPVPLTTNEDVTMFCLTLMELLRQYQDAITPMTNLQIMQYQNPIELATALVPNLLNPHE